MYARTLQTKKWSPEMLIYYIYVSVRVCVCSFGWVGECMDTHMKCTCRCKYCILVFVCVRVRVNIHAIYIYTYIYAHTRTYTHKKHTRTRIPKHVSIDWHLCDTYVCLSAQAQKLKGRLLTYKYSSVMLAEHALKYYILHCVPRDACYRRERVLCIV